MEAWSSTTTTCSGPPRTTCGCTSRGTRRYDTSDVPIIVRGEGAYIYDAQGKRYLDGLGGLFVSPAGPRAHRARRRGGRAGQGAGLPPAVVLRAPQRDPARRADRRLRARRPQPGLLHHRWRRGRRVRVEARQELLQAHRQADEAQGDQPLDRLPRHHPGRAVDHRPAAAQAAVRAAGALDVPGARTPTSTAPPRPPAASSTAATPRRSAAGPPTRSPSRSRTRAPTPSPPSSSSRCRTPAAASRPRPATSSGSARSATSTTCCWSPTRSSAPSAGSATCSAPSATATSPTSSPAPRASPPATPRSAR